MSFNSWTHLIYSCAFYVCDFHFYQSILTLLGTFYNTDDMTEFVM